MLDESEEKNESPQHVYTTSAPTSLWDNTLDPNDRRRIESAGMAKRAGFTMNAAILAIDLQNYMIGPSVPTQEPHNWPSVCPTGKTALSACVSLLDAARSYDFPVYYTQMVLRPDGRDAGNYARKRSLRQVPGWMLEGSVGAEIAEAVRPEPKDIVIRKSKPSAFFGTPLSGLLVEAGVDTIVVIGGSTSNCVRATVVDATSLNYRVVVPADCVFDRFDTSHKSTLFDLDRQYADVVTATDLLKTWSGAHAS